MTTNPTVAVFGLGSMGYGMAQSLLRAGHDVYGNDINIDRVRDLAHEGGKSGRVRDFGPEIDVAVIVVLNAEQTESVLFGNDGVVDLMSAGSCVVSCATVAPKFACKMATRCAEAGVHYLDAPISGGAAKAAAGELSVMASGSSEAFTVARPVLTAMAETVFELGDEVGMGSAMKAINQLLAGVHIAAMGEAVTFGLSQGVTPEKTVEVISKCAGTSWMFENRAPHVVDGDYKPGSAINIWLKDLSIVLDIAKEATFSAPLVATALQQFVAAAGLGLGREDDAAVAKIYARNASLTLPGET